MANPEHIKILKKGVEVWNAWATAHPEIIPDFSFADLRRAHLNNAQLKYANLSYAKLSGADLSGAYLAVAYLVQADLSDADLSNANLVDVNLRYANLFYATTNEAKISGTKFNNASVGYTIFTNTDLSEAVGLDTVRHGQPSEVGVSTFYLSQGRIPKIFLRGSGIPEDFITYMRSLTMQPILFYKSFISHSSKDQKFAERLYADLQNKGVRCWLASEDLKIGDRIRTGIDDVIRFHDKLLLVLSKHSVESDWVEQEVETALDRERKEKRTVLFPIRLDDIVMKIDTGWPALIKNTRNIGDFPSQ